ncbi:MAG: DNA ligase [Planctomycetes bacterium]|nr:DNA ligase [Planctomycetota bacterium]
MSKKAKPDLLAEYLAKRDFAKTPEPTGKSGSGGGQSRGAGPGGRPIFVVQKHRARTLHYDFRLEAGGVLKSWAVPKGPSMNPKDKRLAVAVEDHPLDYAGFEGTIPADEYGAGPVIVWDAGVYRNLMAEKPDGPATVAQALAAGHVEVCLEGEKLRGNFALVHTKMGGSEKNWLLIKMRDAEADDAKGSQIADARPNSVLSGRSIDEVADADA